MRIGWYALVSLLLIIVSLIIGVLGYHYLNGLSWLDALVNASMILTGMGPVDPLKNDAAKWFASAYAIFSGVAFLSIIRCVAGAGRAGVPAQITCRGKRIDLRLTG